MAGMTEELDFKFYLICINFDVDINSHMWLVVIVLKSAALGIQNRGEEIHLNQGSKFRCGSLNSQRTQLGCGCNVRSRETSQRVISEQSLKEGVGRRRGNFKYTQICSISHQGLCSASTLVEIETYNQNPGSPLSCVITRAHLRRMKEY